MFQGTLRFTPILLQGFLSLWSKQEIISPFVFKFWATSTAEKGIYLRMVAPHPWNHSYFHCELRTELCVDSLNTFSSQNLCCITSMEEAHIMFPPAVQQGPFKILHFIPHINIYTHTHTDQEHFPATPSPAPQESVGASKELYSSLLLRLCYSSWRNWQHYR